ncbi:MAG TPA: phosphoglycolate phosphatase [Nitrosomonas nitrosa]|nr:phosphoglycolate phosphatase [Nitrosomonas nitrosa]HNP52942.1 HAD-IA family hydrolase [Nitrosomonas nitrosa]
MIEAILFDFDGTIADTAPDLGYALNRQLIARGFSPLPIEQIRTQASAGSRGLLNLGFNLKPGDSEYETMRDEFLRFYAERLCHETRLFPGIVAVLDRLEVDHLPWGIVTNKPARFTRPLTHALGLEQRAACIISGDETTNTKPHPEPLLTACRHINVSPQNCIYVGDDIRDVKASLAAGIKPIVARYGYLGNDAPPESWGADHIIDRPEELLNYL